MQFFPPLHRCFIAESELHGLQKTMLVQDVGEVANLHIDMYRTYVQFSFFFCRLHVYI